MLYFSMSVALTFVLSAKEMLIHSSFSLIIQHDMKKLTFHTLMAAAMFCSFLFQACQKESLAVQAKGSNLCASATDRCMCLPPYTISIASTTSSSATIVWDEMPESMGYEVEWIMGTNTSEIDSSLMWTAFTEDNSMVLQNLKPDREYGVRVINVCRLLSSDPPGWVAFKTSHKAVASPKDAAIVE